MNTVDTVIRRVMVWVVALLVPFVLFFTSIRLLMTPAFLQFEYHTPNFPADMYGFTLQDRLHWSPYAVDYLINDADISYLGNLKFADGTPLYNERELSHMVDVKNLVQLMLKVWAGTTGLLIGLGLAAWGGRLSREYRRGLSYGGWLTIGLVFAILIGVAISFNGLFTEFHHLFFKGDTWLFYYSDTLIRLFPLRFWRDAFIIVGVISLAGGFALGYLLRDRYPRHEVVAPLK